MEHGNEGVRIREWCLLVPCNVLYASNQYDYVPLNLA